MEALRENNLVRLKDKRNEGELIAEIAEEIGSLSVGIADVVGHTLEVRSAIDSQNQRLQVIAEATREITEANRNIADLSKLTNDIAGQAREDIGSSTESIRSAVSEMGGLISAVEESGTELSGLEVAMEGVTRVTNDIRTVARQTNMLAINASVEAARAGQAGVGFAVVANEVKALARKTAEATVSIDRTLAALTNRIRRLTERMAVSAERAVMVGKTASTIGGAVEKVGLAVTRVCDQAEGIAVATGNISERCDQFRESVEALNVDATRSTVALNGTADNVSRVLSGAESILMLTATSGFPTQDTPFLEKAMETAAAVQACFMRSIESGDISVDDLFDKQLKPIPNTNPQQFMTRYIEFLEWAVNPLCDAVLNFDKRVVWCAPTDHNKMIPSHNPNFSRPPSSDPVWNAAHCRNRRIYTDKNAAAVATSTAPFLLQTYRRDMGGGVFVLMKDASAPVFVGGRLWGGIRVCYSAT